jgi:hypothetical protein
MKPRPHLRLATIAAAMLSVAVPRQAAWANMAAPPDPHTVHAGSRLGEPAGGLKDVFIEHETLRFDLRPLADGKPAWVEATYRERNDGAARALELLFVANGLARGTHSVTVDGRPVASKPGVAGALPPSWRAPESTPAFDSAGRTLPYEPRGEGTLAFRVQLPPGRHQIRVRYPAEATAYSVNDLTPVWQLGYVLAPAREWGGFGGAEVRVEAPRGWRVATRPALRREGGAWVGRWSGLPADAFAISTQQPEPSSAPWYLLWLALTLLVLAGLCRVGWRMGASLGRRGRTSVWALPGAAVLAIAWTVLSIVGYVQVPSLLRWQIGPYPGDYPLRAMSYGSPFFLILIAPVMLVGGTIAIQLCVYLARRRAETAKGTQS